jgi:predicted phage tail protein
LNIEHPVRGDNLNEITLVIVHNPFDERDRTYKQVAVVPGKPVFDYTIPELMLPPEETAINYNGRIVEDDEFKTLIPQEGDFIIIMERVGNGDTWKSIITVVAIVVIMYFAWYVAGPAVAETYGAFWGSVASSAIIYVGGRLMQQWGLTGAASDKASKSSSTYSWNGPSTTMGQGHSVPLTYGKILTAGQLLVSHVSSNGDNQYLNLLLCGGEGEIDDINAHDREALYDTLLNRVVPTYYENRTKWVDMMKESIRTTRDQFATKRMLEQYYNELYIK